MKTRLLTVAQLEQAGACDDGVTVFRELFGESVEVSVDLADKYHKELRQFVPWAAKRLLSEKGYEEYLKINDAALKEYRKIEKPAYEEYQKIRDAASVEYRKIKDAAYGEYRKIIAKAFVEIYVKE